VTVLRLEILIKVIQFEFFFALLTRRDLLPGMIGPAVPDPHVVIIQKQGKQILQQKLPPGIQPPH
jgi:hypothetical protein